MAGSAVEEIKARVDVADVVGQYVPLKRAGRTLKGLCPFHAEKTPSFVVWPETGTWRCFGCGEGGDLFSFVEKREGVEFGEALRMLAARAGVELPSRERQTPEEEQAEARLRAVLSAAELYFRAALKGSGGSAGLAYLERRGVTAASIERFAIGWAPASGLLAHLQGQGFSASDAVAVGVAGQRDDGRAFDYFRSRVIFPIRDAAGRTVGFGGRTLGDDQPKYLNGPGTRFFDKGATLFALDLARAAIRQSGRVVVVEGYLDALMAHQHGFENVVATLGTSLTARHLELLGRRTQEVILALDADTAGQAATMRGLEVAQNAPTDAVIPVPVPGIRGLVRYQAVRRSQIKILSLPLGLDPDDLIRRDRDEWARLVSAATPVVDFVLNRLAERHELSTAAGKREAIEEAAMLVFRDLADPVEREHYVQRLAGIVGLDESGTRAALGAALAQQRSRPISAPRAAVASVELAPLAEAYALALHFLQGGTSADLGSDEWDNPESRALVHLFASVPPEDRTEAGFERLREESDPSVRPALDQVAEWLPRVAGLSTDERRRELEVALLKLRQRQLRNRYREVQSLLAEQSDGVERTSAASLLATIAHQLQQIESALLARHGVGSLVWRSRQVGEVIGG